MSEQPKKMLILAILDILQKQTDEEHRLLQADIMARLEADYGMTATRKSIRRNLADLQEAGYPVFYHSGWYYEHEFTGAELNLLLDSLMCNSAITGSQRQALAAKIGALGGAWYRPSASEQLNKPANPQFLYVLDTLHEAIRLGKQVAFHYTDYDVDKQLHPRLADDGSVKEYVINPYRIAMTNGRPYLICNVDKYASLAHFRVDRIVDIRLRSRAVKPLEKVRGAEKGIDLPEYLAAHPYMYAGEIAAFRLIADRGAINDLLDWFGMDTQLTSRTDGSVLAEVRTDRASLDYWLRRYGDQAQLEAAPQDAPQN